MKQKRICWARVAKNVAYFIVPIFGIILISSIACLSVLDTDIRLKDAKDYYETRMFSDQYLNSIYQNYHHLQSAIKEDAYRENNSNTESNELYSVEIYSSNLRTDKEETIYYYSNNNSNFLYLMIDLKTKIAITNLDHIMRTDTVEGIKQELRENEWYWNYEGEEVQTNISNLKLEEIRYFYQFETLMGEDIAIYTALLKEVPYSDMYSIAKLGCDFAIKAGNMAPILIPISIIVLTISTIMIIRGVGKTAKQEEIYLNWFDKWKLEIVLWICMMIIAIGTSFFITIPTGIRTLMITGLTIGIVIIYLGFVLLLETMIKRIKTHTLWKSTLIYSILQGIKDFINHRNISTKLAIFYWGFCILGFILTSGILSSTGSDKAFCTVSLITIGIVAFTYLYRARKQFEIIQNALKSIYQGNTKISLNPNEMKGVLQELAIYIEDIAGGLSNAVKESLKSERLKTELITNVSHDIKTPLTSIINYVDLLKKEKMPNEKCMEYLMILDNKSQRLKKLTEDLVEASKASSGNIKLKMEKINVVELLKQVSGEFEDRFRSRGLEEVMNVPEEPIFMMADGRYMYRVLENIYSNSAKYAMENSRVYVDVIKQSHSVVIQMKNVSQDRLNISVDELMQRFVRGEASRNTEGSGLGLSIAQSLTELQKGKFHVYLDGDLFKVTLGFEISPKDVD